MKVLQLTKKFPFPLRDGESIAVTQIARGLVNHGVHVHLVSFNTVKHYYEFNAAEIPHEIAFYSSITVIDLDNRPNIFGALINLFSNKSYHIARFISKEFKHALTKLLTNSSFDIIQIESIYLMPYFQIIRQHSDAKIVLRTHNVEFTIWESISKRTKNIFKKWYLDIMTIRLKNYELKNVFNPDLVVGISNRDMESFQKHGHFNRSIVVSPSVKTVIDPKQKSNNVFIFGFIGSLDWQPNYDGLLWFIKEVLPIVQRQMKRPFLFRITGRNKPKDIVEFDHKNVEIVHETVNAEAFIQSLHLMIVPLFTGSGIRIKILESMSFGTPVVSTEVGYSGLDLSHRQDIIQANDAQEFCNAIVEYSNKPEVLSRIANNGQEFIKRYHNENIISRQMYSSYKELISFAN